MLFYGGWFDVGYGLVLIGLVVSLWASWNVKSTFRRYQNDHNSRGLTAAQVARQILDDNGFISDPDRTGQRKSDRSLRPEGQCDPAVRQRA